MSDKTKELLMEKFNFIDNIALSINYPKNLLKLIISYIIIYSKT